MGEKDGKSQDSTAMQLDKCKTCVQYIITNKYDNGIFYGCRLGRPLNCRCKPQKQGCPNCTHYKMPKACPWTNQRIASTGQIISICNAYLRADENTFKLGN